MQQKGPRILVSRFSSQALDFGNGAAFHSTTAFDTDSHCPITKRSPSNSHYGV